MAFNCQQFNHHLFRRTPDWDKELAKDRHPHSFTYSGLYESSTWPSFTGTTHTWDKVHVTRPNDDGNWQAMSISGCALDVCDPSRKYTGWGSTRSTYTKYHQDYQSPVFCFDTLRHVEEAIAQLEAIIEGHKQMPDEIVSDFLRLLSLRTCGTLYICDSGFTSISISDASFSEGMTKLDVASTANLPTSKLCMPYLNHYLPQLMYNGYHNRSFIPGAKFTCMTDMQTQQELCNANPALSAMYTSADFTKGGKFYAYGVMSGCGDWLFKVDPTPLRFYQVGSTSVLKRVWPFQNVAATIGKKPQFDAQYEAAPYQLSHVYARAARKVFVGDTTPVHPEMKFLARDLMGKWSWKAPDYFKAMDPNTGTVCEYNNDKKNKGYFLGEFELGVKTEYPEIEMWVLHLRESAPMADVPRAQAIAALVAQTLTPYNTGCDPGAPLIAEEA